ncbi:MAG: hypothetical protein M5T61_07010 [Acidimicrobiia bacterium]|nr:hypothetical protein [Acidimicrobiia bacterium]
METVRTLAAAILLAACSSGSGSGDSGPSMSAGATPYAAPTATDIVPSSNLAPDRGCLDAPGTLRALVTAWYPGSSGSPLSLNGNRDTTSLPDSFLAAAASAVRDVAPGYTAGDGVELSRADGCITHRFATFTNGDDTLVVSAWRVESEADPFWIPNENPFVALDDSTSSRLAITSLRCSQWHRTARRRGSPPTALGRRPWPRDGRRRWFRVPRNLRPAWPRRLPRSCCQSHGRCSRTCSTNGELSSEVRRRATGCR